ncbi:hypothetical protein SE15_05020 [Thermanaerothrix daxensis]|uniref:Glycosyltransferase RgtA/B/C/D-like domain-containing protein n=1 Tax=Thermanaerothrix daxensis TaxID=869279 RepID=A0A0P6YNV2_9CHLR|nr:hypothetical protein [Thermanaerothrix daxensis]KPL84464.1 hypothetical protein SE15_05020 [Thermanaerothrix daxensis]
MKADSRLAFILALGISLLSGGLTLAVTQNIFEGIPHLEDEYAYLWEARVMARGEIKVPSPSCPRCFLVPFVVDYQGFRFGKYPPGWPAALSLAVRLGNPGGLNILLAAWCTWLTFRLVSKLTTPVHGVLAALLTAISPFFLMNAGSLLSHTFSFFLTLAFALAWLDVTTASSSSRYSGLKILLAGLSLGLLALTRPLTALGIAAPFFVHGILILLHGPALARQRILIIGTIAGSVASLLVLWQYALTGNPWLNPYTLWWPYDRVGFGPGIGLHSDGHQPHHAWVNTLFSLRAGSSDLFGWGQTSWLFIPVGLVAARKNRPAWLVIALGASLILAYGFYWIGAWVFGPRYYYEGLISATFLTSVGIISLAGRLPSFTLPFKQRLMGYLRFGFVSGISMGLILANVWFYLPARLGQLHGLYGATRAQLTPFESPQAQTLTPALVIVHIGKSWREYGTLSTLSSPFMDSPFLFTISRGFETDAALSQEFSQRKTWHYYPDTPYVFYTAPRVSESP